MGFKNHSFSNPGVISTMRRMAHGSFLKVSTSFLYGFRLSEINSLGRLYEGY